MNRRFRGDWNCYLYDEAECFRFHVEGNLCDAHAGDLEQSRLTASSVIGSRFWVLTLGKVSRIEPLGRALLRQWSRDGVRIVARSRMLGSIVQSIAGETPAPRNGPQPSATQLWEEYVDSAVSRIEDGQRCVGPRRVPHPLIRHYAEAVFVPGSTLDQALGVAPDPGQSDCEWCTVLVDDRRAYTVVTAKRIESIREFGAATRRLTAITRFREQDGGVYIEIEAIGLACGIPACLRWLVEPFVRRRSVSLSRFASAPGGTGGNTKAANSAFSLPAA